MVETRFERGYAEMRDARTRARGLFWSVAIFSSFVNLLMLTGPIFMLQVYDRVLGSRSEETLLSLAILMGFLFFLMGILDFARRRVLSRIAARLQHTLDARVFRAVLRRDARGTGPAGANNTLRDLESVQRFVGSPVFAAIFDAPWTPVFLFGIALFHPWLGILAVCGGAVLVFITVINQIVTRAPQQEATAAAWRADQMSEQLRGEAEMVQALGLEQNSHARWELQRRQALETGVNLSDWSGGLSITSKTFRLFLQSAMLGLGAYLVLQQELTPGAMIAASILLGRALAPIDMVIGQWAMIQRAHRGWRAVAELLAEFPPEEPRTPLPRPKAHLTCAQVTVIPPGSRQPVLQGITFEVRPGTAMGVIGASGSGKSSLARALTGVWPAVSGKIRIDGAALDQYEAGALGRYIGYLPQRVQMFEGTIAENIAKMSLEPDGEKVVRAAQAAAAHDMILQLPDGYDTRVSAGGGTLSGGQMQRVALARAIYDDPVLLILDEPNSNLDSVGSNALNAAIRQMKADGRSVLIMAHRPAAIQECEMLLVLEGGKIRKYGPRDEVLAEVVQNFDKLNRVMKEAAE
ncbi:type I secretion system permease/ATPase [Roseovarius spongiae]|uniref:Type I secretion system permease/ATPase n=1 Tax=Roseovarius spongiae TaxID=2320272 RepID=A0A3A8AWM5_9RHOB|nr:type I secretion system permease/ATPase [Roseovarius spongiae]RKF16773.1 type I secretion system permease/ATPase [Roseovarius spongiae]